VLYSLLTFLELPLVDRMRADDEREEHRTKVEQ
jgi:hypothetical protein